MSELSGQTSVIHLCMVQLKPENKQTENLRSTYGLKDLLQLSASSRVKVPQLLFKYSDIYSSQHLANHIFWTTQTRWEENAALNLTAHVSGLSHHDYCATQIKWTIVYRSTRNSDYLIVAMKTCSKFLSEGNTIVTWWLLVQMKRKETYGKAYIDKYWLFRSLQNQGHVSVVAWAWQKNLIPLWF